MAASDQSGDDSLYPIAVLIDELKNEDVQVIEIYLLLLLMSVKLISHYEICCNFIFFLIKVPLGKERKMQ